MVPQLKFPLLLLLAAAGSDTASAQCDPTPELSALSDWTSDPRASATAASLPPIQATSPSCPTDPLRQKVLLLGVDGLRTDAAAMLPLPNLRRLERMGTYSYWADTQQTGVTYSGPAWCSMFTGVEAERHGVTDGNSESEIKTLSYPTVFKLVKDAFDKRIAASVVWDPLVDWIIDHEDPTTLDARYITSSDADMASVAEGWIRSGEYDFVFADFDGVDGAGHGNTFDGYATAYGVAVANTDALIGELLDAVIDVSAGEEWLIVLTSDHGGKGGNHGGDDIYNRKVPFMVASNSPRVNIGHMTLDDPGSQMDVLPTIMHFLGGPEAVPEGLDGQVFGFNDYTRAPPPTPAPTEPCVNTDPTSCGCADVDQADYRGNISVTKSGLTCQAWDSQSPHNHDRTDAKFPGTGLDGGHNHCRNPDGEPGAWCYTTDPDTRWELCDVPMCGDGPTPPAPTPTPPPPPPAPTSSPTESPTTDCDTDPNTPKCCGTASLDQADYRGTISVTVNGWTCQAWDSQSPHSHSRTDLNYPDSGLGGGHNHCRNPDGEPGAWCYTTDPDKRWELCDVPTCGAAV